LHPNLGPPGYSRQKRGIAVANNLWTAFIADNGSNDILAASSADGATWTPSVPINQTSPFTPSLTLFNGSLYAAFISDDEDSATGIPSNRIFLTSTTDGVTWSSATFFNQYSKCAPSLAVWNGSLCVAFVANNPSNTLLVYSSSTPDKPESWSATVATNQTSTNAPSLASYAASGEPGDLYLAFVAANGSEDIFVCSLSVGGTWSKATVTGESCHFSPSLAVLGKTLYLVFAAANGSKDLYLSSLKADGTWSGSVAINQSSAATPCAVAFGSSPSLYTGYITNNSSGEVLVSSNPNPSSSWTGGNLPIKQQSAAGPAIAVAPFACSWQLVKYAGTLGGSTQYVFWTGLGSDNRPIPVADLVVEIDIAEALVVSPTLGTPPGSPIGFQINGLPPRADQQPGQVTTDWTATPGDLAIGWVQYGAKMWPNTTKLIAWSQYWPPAVQTNPNVAATFTANIPNADTATLPSDLTIPGGWKIRFVFNYSQESPGTITGFDCKVTDNNGQSVVADMGINFLASPNVLTTGGPIGLGNLSQLIAFQVVLVGFYASAQAVLVSGGGSITVQASTPLTVQTSWPADAVGSGGTAENCNCTYVQLPAGPSKSFTQPFAVP
jgi:hypothetical protein